MAQVHSTAKEGSYKWRGLSRTTVLSAVEINPLDELGLAVWDSEMQKTKSVQNECEIPVYFLWPSKASSSVFHHFTLRSSWNYMGELKIYFTY